MLRVCRRFTTTALPVPLAACSRLIRCRSTNTCRSNAERSCKLSENDSCISGSPSTCGLTSSRIELRSAFFAQPGKGRLRRFRAFVHCFQKRAQALYKRDVAFAASKATSFFEVGLAKTARGAFLGRCSFFELVCCAQTKEQIGQRETGGILNTFFLRASFAQI